MKIIDQLQECPFCISNLVRRPILTDSTDYLFECPLFADHMPNELWAYYDETKLMAVNIQYDDYQLHLNFRDNNSQVWGNGSKSKMTKITCSGIINFQLTEANIKNKIQTLLLLG